MKNRPAFELRGVLIIYNIFQIIFNGWMFYQFCRLTWFNGYSLVCQPADFSYNDDALQLVMVGYCFFISKFIDFLDTFFFILRKKNNQITFLHLFHHGIMPLSVWPCFRFIGGGHAVFLVTFNSFVHFVMYFYYLMSAMGPAFRKYLWWKKYLTGFQMFQFVCVAVHSSQLVVIECDFPIAYFWWAVTQAVAFFFLFKNFHSGAYSKSIDQAKNSRSISPLREKKLLWSAFLFVIAPFIQISPFYAFLISSRFMLT